MGKERENLKSRMGFLFLAAGCAIGLGNVWRFPFIAGKYGGGAFVLLYFFFLLAVGLPILVMELAIGRAARRGIVGAYRDLEKTAPTRFRWEIPGMVFFAGNLLLMMFYTTISGWLLAYTVRYCLCMEMTDSVQIFREMSSSTGGNLGAMGSVVLLATLICSAGLRNGIERTTKWMMSLLLLLLLGLCGVAVTLPDGMEGVKFLLLPDFDKLFDAGTGEAVIAALGQAFFTLSIGIGSIAIFGSYIDRQHSLSKEGIWIIVLDTGVAILAGLLIFPICFSFPGPDGPVLESGPSLIFVTLPKLFEVMQFGSVFGAVFFLFLTIAAMTTVVAVFENLIAFLIDEWHMNRKVASLLNGVVIFILSIPCALGFGALSCVQPLGEGSTILDFEDFLVSENLLPLGALYLLCFCVFRYGWGWQNFLNEANAGEGVKFPACLGGYLRWILPVVILAVLINGYIDRFF